MRVIDKNRQKASPGGPEAKSPFITIMKTEDLESEATPNAKGILHEGLYQMKLGKEPMNLYNTGSFQGFSFETDGDEDAASIQKTLTARHPGDTLEIREFIGEQTDVDVVVMFGGGCGSGRRTVIGGKCAPIKMRANLTKDNDGTYYELTFSNMSSNNIMPGFYDGPDPVANAFAGALALSLLEVNGPLQKLPSSALAEAVTVADIDFPTGSFISILGGGGTDPAVITDGAGTAAQFVLKDGTQFIGLEGARITFEVFIAGTTTYLIERSRA